MQLNFNMHAYNNNNTKIRAGADREKIFSLDLGDGAPPSPGENLCTKRKKPFAFGDLFLLSTHSCNKKTTCVHTIKYVLSSLHTVAT